MDDRELEARLKTRLHARFDDPPVPLELASSVRHVMTTAPRPLSFALRTRGMRVGWPAIAAAAIAVGAVVIAGNIGGPIGPGNLPSPTLAASAPAERQFIVLPPAGMPSKPETTLASDVLAARLRALGIGTFQSGGGYVLEFTVPAGGPSDDMIRAVLGATGDVEFVPLPNADYGLGVGKRQAAIGQPLPKDEPALFGWEGIASANAAYDPANSIRTVNVSLKPDAAAAFGDYTTSHPGETFAIVIDGRVAMLPIISEPITGGEVNVSGGIEGDFLVTSAILVGGMLPESWRGATVPALISRSEAVAAALAATHGGSVQFAGQGAEEAATGDPWRVMWNIEVVQPDCTDVTSCVSPGWSTFVKVDAVTGAVVHIGALAP
jgi:hypothetical protein